MYGCAGRISFYHFSFLICVQYAMWFTIICNKKFIANAVMSMFHPGKYIRLTKSIAPSV